MNLVSGLLEILVKVFLITDVDTFPIGLWPLSVNGIDTDDDSTKSSNRGIGQPTVPVKAVSVLAGPPNYGTNSGNTSGDNTFPMDPSLMSNQRT
jgi:hypothetical protein